MDRRCQNAVAGGRHPGPTSRTAPAEFGTDGDLAEALRLAGEQAGRQVLVRHEERRPEPPGGLLDAPGLVGIVDRVEAALGAKSATSPPA